MIMKTIRVTIRFRPLRNTVFFGLVVPLRQVIDNLTRSTLWVSRFTLRAEL